jgi:hypothetical protein
MTPDRTAKTAVTVRGLQSRVVMRALAVAVRQYLVVKRHGQWFAKSCGRFGVPYTSEAKAIHGAVKNAKKCGENGKPAMVALFNKQKKTQPIWTFGEGPYL